MIPDNGQGQGSPWRRVFGFAMVGVIGFVVDASVLTLLKPDLGPYGARGVSFLCAVTTTFALNRRFVFDGGRDRPLLAQAGLFLAANSVGMVINNLVYALLVHAHGAPVAGVAAGSILGGVSNFLASDRIVFRARKRHDPTS